MDRRWFVRWVVATGAAALVVSAVGAAPARAVPGTRLSRRRRVTQTLEPRPHVHLMPTRSVAASLGLPTGSSRFSTVNLTYNNGPVMQAGTHTVPIFWEPAQLQDGTPKAVSDSYNSLIQRFFTDVGGHALYNNLTQYYQVVAGATTQYIVNSSGFLQGILDTSAYPTAGSACSSNSLVNCVTDAQIQAEVASVVTTNSLPTDLSTMYVLVTDPMENSCFDANNCFNPGTGADFTFCAYHGEFDLNGDTSRPVVYANMPYVDSNSTSISGCTGTSAHPNDPAFDDETSVLSHEFNEAITDPLADGSGWYDNMNGEIGDICNAQVSAVTWAGHTYEVQKEWSNANAACVAGANQEASIAPSSGVAGTTVSLTGAGFTANHSVSLSFSDAAGTVTALASATSDGSGSFSEAVTIPAGAAVGAGTLDATGATFQDGASVGFTVAAVKRRPDTLIATAKAGPFKGDNVYDATGASETLAHAVKRGGTTTFWVKIQNDGNTSDTITLKGPKAATGFTIAYKVGSTVVSSGVEAGTYHRKLQAGKSFLLQVVIGAKATTSVGKVFKAKVLGTSQGNTTKKDAVIASAKAK